MEQKNAQPFPSSCHQVILAPSTRRWWRFGPSSCLEILHSPQSQSSAWNIQYGQEVAVGEEVLSYWVCIVKSTSGESYMGNQLLAESSLVEVCLIRQRGRPMVGKERVLSAGGLKGMLAPSSSARCFSTSSVTFHT